MTLLDTRPGESTVTRPVSGHHPALAALVEAGLLAWTDAAGCHVRDLSRAHPVWGVATPDGRRLIVKTHAPERGADLGIELLVYRLAVWCAPVRAAVPEAVHVDEDRHLLVLADVGGASLAVRTGFAPQLGLPGPARLDSAWLAATSARLGRTVGVLHRGTRTLPLPPARPPLALTGLSGRQRVPGPLGALCAPLAADPVIADAAAELAGPVAGCLVSHDMKWDNVALAADGRLVLLDWELAGLGDPAVDLGFLLAEHLLRDAPNPLSDAARALVAGYAAGAGVRTASAPVLARRTVLAAGLRIAQLAVEVGDSRAGSDAVVADLSALARAELRRVPERTEEVRSCLS